MRKIEVGVDNGHFVMWDENGNDYDYDGLFPYKIRDISEIEEEWRGEFLEWLGRVKEVEEALKNRFVIWVTEHHCEAYTYHFFVYDSKYAAWLDGWRKFRLNEKWGYYEAKEPKRYKVRTMAYYCGVPDED